MAETHEPVPEIQHEETEHEEQTDEETEHEEQTDEETEHEEQTDEETESSVHKKSIFNLYLRS